MPLPYGSASRNPRGDTPNRGAIQEAYACIPSFDTYQSPEQYYKTSYMKGNRGLRFGNQNRFRRTNGTTGVQFGLPAK